MLDHANLMQRRRILLHFDKLKYFVEIYSCDCVPLLMFNKHTNIINSNIRKYTKCSKNNHKRARKIVWNTNIICIFFFNFELSYLLILVENLN